MATSIVGIQCSFCGVSLRDAVTKLIAGPPHIYVCFHCVGLLHDIKQRDPDVQIHDVTADATPDANARRVRELEAALRTAVQAMVRVLPPPHAVLCCLFCDADLAGVDDARDHTAMCDKHPAVVALQAVKAAQKSGVNG